MILFEEPGLIGLELWRGISRHASLHQLRDAKHEYFPALRDFLVALHDGSAASPEPEETRSYAQARSFDRVILCGGEASHPLLAQAMGGAALPFAFEIHETGPTAGRQGAIRIFHQMRWRCGLAFDLGQTHLKVITAQEVTLIPRDATQMPFGVHALDAETGRARLRDFLARAMPRANAPDGVILGLPVELKRDGTARPSTYPGLFGPIEPIFAPLFPMPWVAINDAMLAALGFAPPRKEKRLVVTLGFGVGGALWNP